MVLSDQIPCGQSEFVFVCVSAEFPMPKTELVQKFHVLYLGMTSVSRPIGKYESVLEPIHQLYDTTFCITIPRTSTHACVFSSGMDIINGAIENLLSSTGKEDWTPVILSIADTTVAVIKEKAWDFLLLWGKTNIERMRTYPSGKR